MTGKQELQLHGELKVQPDNYMGFSLEFRKLLAALHLHGFYIARADEANNESEKEQALWSEIGHPSVWMHAHESPNLLRKLRPLKAGSKEHAKLSEDILRLNLHEQYRLLEFLEQFYKDRDTPFYARLIVENIDLGESLLRSQGSTIRLILEDKNLRQKWLKQSQEEMNGFAAFLISKL